jgi:hypothetical protein
LKNYVLLTFKDINWAPLLAGAVNLLHDVSILNEGIPELLAELKSNKVSTLAPFLSGLLSNAFEKNPFGRNEIINKNFIIL